MHATNLALRQAAAPDAPRLELRTLLVASDLSMSENFALERACRIAHAARATVKLMYLPPRGQPPAADAARRLANAAKDLEESLELRVKTVPLKAHRMEDLWAQARGSDLVVLPHRRERSTAAFFRGQPVLRLLRACRCPVLVTRQPGTEPWRRILVAVDFAPGSARLVQLAAALEPQARLEIFHAISILGEARLRAAEATEHAVRAYRERALRHAHDRMLALARSVGAPFQRASTAISRGDPGRQAVVQQQRTGADLVVLGKRRSSAWEDFLCGSVAHRVLSWGSSDVLVVPQATEAATARAAAPRGFTPACRPGAPA